MFLERIIAATRALVEERKAIRPESELLASADGRPTRALAAALRRPGITAIAEIKRASPSKGPLCPNLDAPATARQYAAAGAAAISVLTEPSFFQGSLDDLAAVREAVDLPLLRKDFIVDPYQVFEARAFGADAYLLIVSALEQATLVALLGLGRRLGMEALVEVHDEAEVERAIAAGATLIGINNRNLADFRVDLENAPRLRRSIPPNIVVVGESGIHTPADVARLAAARVDAILVGEALVTSDDPGAKLRWLLGNVEKRVQRE